MPELTMFLGEVPLTPDGVPLTPELAAAIIPALEHHATHSHGHRLQSTCSKMEAFNYYAKIVYLTAGSGGANEFNQKQIELLLDIRRTRFTLPGRHPFLDKA